MFASFWIKLTSLVTANVRRLPLIYSQLFLGSWVLVNVKNRLTSVFYASDLLFMTSFIKETTLAPHNLQDLVQNSTFNVQGHKWLSSEGWPLIFWGHEFFLTFNFRLCVIFFGGHRKACADAFVTSNEQDLKAFTLLFPMAPVHSVLLSTAFSVQEISSPKSSAYFDSQLRSIWNRRVMLAPSCKLAVDNYTIDSWYQFH